MKIVDGVKYFTIGEVGKYIKRTTITIKMWYKWAEANNKLGDLPKIYYFGSSTTRYFTQEGAWDLKDFADSINYGDMSEFNSYRWGERGQLIRERGSQRQNMKR